MGLDGIDLILKLASLDVLDDVINLNQSIWIWFIAHGFSGIVILNVRPIIYILWFSRTFSQSPVYHGP